MTDNSSIPPITVTSTDQPTARDYVLQLVQAGIGLAGLAGLSLPPIATNIAVQQQLVSIILVIAALAGAAYHRLVTAPKVAHAAAVASARLGRPSRPATTP